MKKKILLAALFSVTAVLAAIGLATEKSNAKGWYGDDPFWMETGESVGMSSAKTVYCNERIVRETGYIEPGHTHIEYVIMAIERIEISCHLISTEPCTPSNPC